jgi:hypothetical protein
LSNALSEKMPAAKPKIAFIEPPERAVFILDRCARSAMWDVSLLVATSPDSQAVRVALARGIPVRTDPDPELLTHCDRVIVGQVPFHTFLSLRQLMRDKPGRVVKIDEFLPEMVAREEDATLESAAKESAAIAPAEPRAAIAGGEAPSPMPAEAARTSQEMPPPVPVEWAESVTRDETPPPLAVEPAELIADDEVLAPPPPEFPALIALGEALTPPPFELKGRSPRTIRVAEVRRTPPPLSDRRGLVPEPPPSPIPAVAIEPTLAIEPAHPGAAAPLLPPPPPAALPSPPPPPVPLPAFEAEPFTPSPVPRAMPAPPPLRFDARTFLGAPIHDAHTSIRLDFQDGRIQHLIDEARQLADATAVNLMLLEPDGEHLRVVAASGLGAEVTSLLRPHIGVGPPGQAFQDRKPAFSRSQAFDLGESDGRPRWRVLASVPITVSQQSIGVVTVKFVSASHLRDEEVIARMDRLAHAMPAALIGAVDLSDLPRPQQREALQLLIDRLMSLDEALPGRLSAFAAALRRVIGAEAIRIFMLDSMEGRLVEIASHEGWTIRKAVPAYSNFAFLREVMLRGDPMTLPVEPAGDTPSARRETSTIGFPIQAEHARCLMLLENVPTAAGAHEQVLELLQDMVALLEEMINIEQGMVVQEFISELSMRMADRKEQIDLLPLSERTTALLELAIELVAAEVAIWIPDGSAPPEVSIPTTSEGGRIRAWALAHAPGLAAWLKRKGEGAQGVLADRIDPSAPCGPAPWIGVIDPRERGVLVLFFDAQELAEAPRQVPPHVLWRVLTGLCQLMPDPPATDRRSS